MKLRKSIWFILFLSVISTSLNIGKAYGFSLSSSTKTSGFNIKKSNKEDNNSPFSFFFEEEDINESEDDSILEMTLFYVTNQSELFTSNPKKIQNLLPENFSHFRVSTQPIFIIFRNLRL